MEHDHSHLSRHVESTLRRIGFCRTASLNGRIYRCRNCDSTVPVYNSCADRHCPQCQGARRADWVDKTAQLVRAGIPHFHVIFTLPGRLSSVVLGNRRGLYRLLFHSAAAALQQSLRVECGRQAAAAMVLHTWNQRLEHHPHVHALVPGSGPSRDGSRWVACRYTRARRDQPAKPFLVDVHDLGRRFRDGYLRGVRRLLKAGQLKVSKVAELQAILEDLQTRDWVVHVQPPPRDTSDPTEVLKYLARYMTGGPISDRRLLEVREDQVYFLARAKDKSGRQVPEQLSALEFVRRWALHILPRGFTKVRCYGGWSNTRRQAYQQQCDRLQPGPSTTSDDVGVPQPGGTDLPAEPKANCPRCGEIMILESDTARPPWRELFYGPEQPCWVEWRGSG